MIVIMDSADASQSGARLSVSATARVIGTAVILVAATLIAGTGAGASPARGASPALCHEVRSTMPGTGWTIAGTLCGPQRAQSVQILLHGYTTNRSYWDFPYHRAAYSYVHAAEGVGAATLRVDLPGSGASSHPPSTALSYDRQAQAVHHLVSELRGGRLGGHRFSNVALVGHSSGSLIGVMEAARFHDVDALVTTAFTPMFNVDDVLGSLIPSLTPAVTDPRFARSGLDPGYVTTRAGARAIFYHQADTDPQVIATDERGKDTTAMPMLATVTPLSVFGALHELRLPVLTVNGADDPFSCGFLASDCSSSAALAASNRALIGQHASVEAYVVPHSGHALALEHTAPETAHTILSFLHRHLAR